MKPITTKNDALIVMKALEKESAPAIRKLSNLTITSQDDFVLAGKMLKELKTKAKQAKEREQSLTDPLKAVMNDIQALFKPFRTAIANLELDTKEKMLEFVKTSKDESEKLEQAFVDGKIKKVSTLLAKQNALEVNSDFSQTRKLWIPVCVDEKKTPREYLTPDMPKIREALRAGKNVAGWKWEQTETIAI